LIVHDNKEGGFDGPERQVIFTKSLPLLIHLEVSRSLALGKTGCNRKRIKKRIKIDYLNNSV